MKNKAWCFLAGTIVLLVLLRLGVNQLSSKSELSIATASTSPSVLAHEDGTRLADAEWEQPLGTETPTTSKGVISDVEWGGQGEGWGRDPDNVATQETANNPAPEQWFPVIAALLNDKALTAGEAKQRQQDLARFVQSVAPAIEAIEASLKSMEAMQLPEAKQQAYTAMGQEKMDALRHLKEQALAKDPSLMSVVIE